jgi:hypothetical protein
MQTNCGISKKYIPTATYIYKFIDDVLIKHQLDHIL